MGGGAMTVAGQLLQYMAHAGLSPDQRIRGDAEPSGNDVGGLETDAVDVEGQAVGVFRRP